MFKLHTIGTSSSGNAYLLDSTDGHALLLDAGLPIRTILRGVEDWRAVEGCLVTHEHLDHIKGAADVARMGVPTYMTQGTIDAAATDGCLTPFNAVQMLSPFDVGEFTVMAFEAQHDAAEPCGYLIRYNPTGETVLYATDTYYLKNTFPDVNYWLIECNFCDGILEKQIADGTLSPALCRRLMKSHMSLRRLLDVFEANQLRKTQAIVLIHLSSERSDERAMVQAVKQHTGIEEVQAAADGQTITLSRTPF